MSTQAWAELLHREAGPLYRQAAQRLRGAIESGALAPGAALPTEAELALGFGVSLITIRSALRELEQGGLIRKRAAKTAVVTRATPRREPPQPDPLTALAGALAAALAGARLQPESLRPARSAEAARLLDLPPRSSMACLRGLLRRTAEREALAAVTIHWPSLPEGGMNRTDLAAIEPFALFARPLAVAAAGARLQLGAGLADAALASRLGCPPGAALLVTRILFADAAGRPVQLVTARHRADAVAPTLAVALPQD